jgi:hypothetical protein
VVQGPTGQLSHSAKHLDTCGDELFDTYIVHGNRQTVLRLSPKRRFPKTTFPKNDFSPKLQKQLFPKQLSPKTT